MTWPWVLTISLVGMLALGDAQLWGRNRPSPLRAWLITATYFAIALLVGVAGYAAWWSGVGPHVQPGRPGHQVLLQFITAFLWQFALDLDGTFVYASLFAHLRTPEHSQRRTLMWGVLPALAVRLGVIVAVGLALASVPWLKFVVSGLLMLAALRMLTIRQENLDPERNTIVRLLRRFVHLSPAEDPSLVTRVGGKLALTPLLVTTVLLETGDAFVALDSIPATLTISRDLLLVFAANGFAVLCARSLHVVLAARRDWIRFIKVGLATVMAYSAVLMSLPRRDQPDTWASLAVLVIAVGSGVVLGAVSRRGDHGHTVSPLGPEADRLAKETLRRARRLIMAVVGVTLLLLGIFMLIGPGPGIPVVFIALSILGAEFQWARRLMERYRERAHEAAVKTAAQARKRFRPWIIIPMLVGTGAVCVAARMWLHLPVRGLWLAAIPMVLGQVIGWWFTFFYHPAPQTAGVESQPPSLPTDPKKD